MKNKILLIVRIAISFGLLGALFWIMREDAREILTTILECNQKYILLALAVFTLNAAALAWRLKIVFHGENLDITFLEAFQLTFMGYFFNNFMPTAVGGDLFKAHFASVGNKERMRSYASVMMDRLIGLYSFLIVAAIALIVDRGRFQIEALRTIVFSLLVFGVIIFITVTNKKIARFAENLFSRLKMGSLGDRLDRLYKIVHDYRNRVDVIAKALAVAIISQSIYFITIYLFFLALGNGIKIGNIFLIMPVVTFISMIPSVGGLGVRESAMVAFFTPVAGRDIAFAASLLLLFGLFFVSLIGGGVYFYWSVFRHRRVQYIKEEL